MAPSLVLTGHDIRKTLAPCTSVEANVAATGEGVLRTIDALVADGYRFVSLEEFLDGYRHGGLALLTFDDAYRSLNQHLLPRLRARRIPLVVFVIGETLIERRDPFPLWLHALRDARLDLGQSRFRPLHESDAIRAMLQTLELRALSDLLGRPLPALTAAMERTCTPSQLADIGELLARLGAISRITMTRAELEEMLDSGWAEIGAHSMSHRSFASLSPAEAVDELAGSIRLISDLTGRKSAEVAFAYPYGAVTTDSARAVARLCRAGFTCANRPLSWFDDFATIPRINLDDKAWSRSRGNNPARTAIATLKERARRYVRTGPPWAAVGPVYRMFKREEARRQFADQGTEL